jgi:methyl-accepting chemotaxis protein
MKQKNYYSLRWRIALVILAGTLFFSALTLYITYNYVNKTLTESLLEEGKIVTENIAELAAEKLIEKDSVELKAIIEKYKFYSHVEYIIIEDSVHHVTQDTYNGQIPSEILEPDNQQPVNAAAISAAAININSQGIEIYDLTQPIKEGLLGYVRVGMRKSYVDSKINEAILYLGIVFIVGTFLAVVLAIFIITLQFSRPIAYLTDMAHKISMGDFNTPVRLNIRNEIGILGEAIERMRESLKTSIERLRKREKV